jgi:hypothetical protein
MAQGDLLFCELRIGRLIREKSKALCKKFQKPVKSPILFGDFTGLCNLVKLFRNSSI